MTNEDRILCYCTLPKLNEKEALHFRNLLETDLDWQSLCVAASRNGLLSFLYEAIKTSPDKIPPDILAALKEKSFHNCARNLMQAGALIKIITLFQAADITAVPFKGPLLSIQLYGDIGRRSFGDLDILIAQKDILHAYEILLSLHYIPELHLAQGRLRKYAIHEDNLSFTHKGHKVIVELHWDLAGAYLSQPLSIQDIEVTGAQFSISGYPMAGFPNETLLVYLCIHGAKHKWERLEWIGAVATLVRKEQNMDWKNVLDFSAKTQSRRMLLLGLSLARDLFGCPLPENIIILIRNDGHLPDLKADSLQSVFPAKDNKQTSPLSKRFSFFHMKVRDSIWDSLRFQLRLVFRPTNVEWQTISLPAPLSFLYFVFRPFRLIWEVIKR